MSAEIFADTGERLTKALVTGSFALYRQALDLPLELHPRNGTPRRLETIEALAEDFRIYRETIELWGITDVYRKPLDIRTRPDGRIDVTCEMHILANAKRVVDPFEADMTLRKTEDGWKFCRIVSSLGHIHWTDGQARISDTGAFTID